MKTAIIIDSTAYASETIRSHPDIYELKFTTTFEDGLEFMDTSDPAILEDFYTKLQQAEKLPTTSQPSPGSYVELVEEVIGKGYDQLLCIHLSGGLSGAYQTANMITADYAEEIKVKVVDSKGASVVIQALIVQALEMLEEGLDLDVIHQKLDWVADNSTIYLTVSDLNNLVKGGRLPSSAAKFGNLLKIKPLLCIGKDGKIQFFEGIRTDKRMNKRLAELAQADFENYPNGIMVGFAHAMDEERLELTVETVMKDLPVTEQKTSVLGSVIGTHTGVGSIGMGIMPIADY